MMLEEDGRGEVEERHPAEDESVPEKAKPAEESAPENGAVSKSEIEALGSGVPPEQEETPHERTEGGPPSPAEDLGTVPERREGEEDLDMSGMPEVSKSASEIVASADGELDEPGEASPDEELDMAEIPEIPRSSTEIDVTAGGEGDVTGEGPGDEEESTASQEEGTFPPRGEGGEELDIAEIPGIPEPGAEEASSIDGEQAETAREAESEEELAGAPADAPGAGPQGEFAPVPEVEEAPAEAEAPRRRIRVPLPSRKVTVSVAAGLMAGLFVAAWLTAHSARQVRQLADSDGGLLTPLDRARALIDDRKYREARQLIERFLDETPASAERSEGLFLLAETLQAIQDEHPTETGYTEARETYRKAIEADSSSPRVPGALKNIARTYLAEDMYKEARDVFDEVVRKYPTLPEIVDLEFEIAKTYQSQGDSSAAIRKLTALISDYPEAELIPYAKLSLGKALESEQRYDEALALYQQVLRSFPQHQLGAEAQERLGDLAVARGDYAEAVALYRERVEMAVAVTDNDRVLLKLARAYGAIGNWDGSVATCRNLLELFKKSELEPETIVQLCRAEEMRGHVEAAIQYAYDGHAKFPENAEIVKILAGLYFLKREYGEAARLYDEAVKVAPDDPQAWFSGAEAHFRDGDLESSYRGFREVTRRFPADERAYDAYLKLADILYMRGDPQRAIDLLRSRLPEHVVSSRRDPILSKMASMYLDLGLPALAADTYAKMLDGADDDEILARMGIASLRAARWDTGLTAFRNVDKSRISPDLTYAMFVEMGVALRGFGDLRGAKQALETSVNEYPAHRDARGVTALLRTYLAASEVTEARKLANEIRNWASGRAERAAVAAQASLVWGDFLFSRGDYLNALEEFTQIAANELVSPSAREWATYQRSNTYFELGRYDKSVAAYEDFLEKYSSSSWKKAAQTRLDVAKLEIRLRDREF